MRLVSTLAPCIKSKTGFKVFFQKCYLCRYDKAAKKAWLVEVAKPMRKKNSPEQSRAFRDRNASMQTFVIRGCTRPTS